MRPLSAPVRAAAATGILAAALGVGLGEPAHASGVYNATASATGVLVMMSSPAIPVVTTPVDLTLPSAQTQVSSLQGTSAFAAYPYPGSDDAALPGTVTGLLAGLVPFPVPSLPGIPTIQNANCPVTPSSGFDGKVFQLIATCDDNTADASASAGLAPTSLASILPTVSGLYTAATASSKTDPKTGDTSATAHTEVTVLSLGGGLLTIGPITSTATVTQSPGSDPDVSSDIALGQIKIAGQAVQLGPGGLTVAGAPVKLPGVADPTVVLNKLLKAANIKMTLLKAHTTKNSVVAPGLEIDATEKDPQNGQPINISLVFGQASASVTGATGGTTSVPTVPSTSPSGSISPTGVTPPSTGTTGGGPAVSIPSAITSGTPSGSETSPVIAPSGTTTPQTQLTSANDLKLRGLSFYPILVVAALAMLAGGTLARYIGVRLWSS